MSITSLILGIVLGLFAGLLLQEIRMRKLASDNARLEAEKNAASGAQGQMAAAFKAMSLEALNASRENFLALAQLDK